MKTTTNSSKVTVTTAGSAAPLSPDHVFVESLTIEALPANAGDVVVGDSGVLYANGNGTFLTAYQSETYKKVFLDEIFIDSANNGDGVSIVYQTRKSIL